jgi:hypothetical protein
MCSLYRSEYSNLKLAEATIRSRLGSRKRSGRDEPMWVVMHMCIETTQRISLCAYLYLKLAKTPFLKLSFMFFLLQNGRTRGQNRR